MDKHVTEWLGAYHDGELEPGLAEQVQSHLATCNDCREILDGIKSLSDLLDSTRTPASDPVIFTRQLTRQLPPRPTPLENHASGSIGWWLIPVCVFVIALVIQISTSMTSFFLTANNAGLLGRLGVLLAGFSQTTAQQESFFDLGNQLLAGNLGALYSGLKSTFLIMDQLIGFILQFALAFVYIAWLVVVWNKRFQLLAPASGASNIKRVSIGV